jgi:hypothetical protein
MLEQYFKIRQDLSVHILSSSLSFKILTSSQSPTIPRYMTNTVETSSLNKPRINQYRLYNICSLSYIKNYNDSQISCDEIVTHPGSAVPKLRVAVLVHCLYLYRRSGCHKRHLSQEMSFCLLSFQDVEGSYILSTLDFRICCHILKRNMGRIVLQYGRMRQRNYDSQ